jgi:hypothetical protein
MPSFVQESGQAATWPEQVKAPIVRYRFEPFGKAMLSFGVSSSTSALQPSNLKIWSTAGLVPPCAWRELQEREYLAGFYVKLGSTESHFDRHPNVAYRIQTKRRHTHTAQGIPHKRRRTHPASYYVVHGLAQWHETGRLQRNNAIDSLTGLAHVPIVVSGNLEYLNGHERNEGRRKKE